MGKLTRLVFVVALLASTLALAQKSADEAKTRFKRGAEFYDEGNFRGALIEFERAYQLLPNYKLLYNIGQVHLQLLEYGRAQTAFARYLKEGGSDVSSSRRDEVNKELERVKTRVGKINVITTEGAEVLLDDESVGTAPLSAAITANTGRHTVTVVVPGRAPQSRVIDLAGQDTANVSLGLAANDSGQAITPKNAGSTNSASLTAPGPTVHSKAPMIFGWVVTGALAVTGGILAGASFGAASELAKLKTALGVTQVSLNTASGKVGGLSAAADIVGLAALIAGGISVWLTIDALMSNDAAVSIGPGGVTFVAKF